MDLPFRINPLASVLLGSAEYPSGSAATIRPRSAYPELPIRTLSLSCDWRTEPLCESFCMRLLPTLSSTLPSSRRLRSASTMGAYSASRYAFVLAFTAVVKLIPTQHPDPDVDHDELVVQLKASPTSQKMRVLRIIAWLTSRPRRTSQRRHRKVTRASRTSTRRILRAS